MNNSRSHWDSGRGGDGKIIQISNITRISCLDRWKLSNNVLPVPTINNTTSVMRCIHRFVHYRASELFSLSNTSIASSSSAASSDTTSIDPKFKYCAYCDNIVNSINGSAFYAGVILLSETKRHKFDAIHREDTKRCGIWSGQENGTIAKWHTILPAIEIIVLPIEWILMYLSGASSQHDDEAP